MLARFASGQALGATAGCSTRQAAMPARCLSGVSARVQQPLLSSGPASAQLPIQQHRCAVIAQGQANSSLRLPIELDLETPLPGFDSISSALEDLAAGKVVVVIDDEDRENEGDLIMNADKVTTETMAFFVEYTSGVVCISMEGQDLDRLKLPLMINSAENEEAMYTAFTVTVDLRDGITTGISASDRAKTIRRLADPSATWTDFRRPGHIFPLRYRPGGVIVRPGHTEAAVDLARLSGSFPAGVLCEIVNKDDGSMSRTPELLEFAKRHGLKCITIADLIRYRLRHEAIVAPAGEPTPLTTAAGARLTAQAFRNAVDGTEHVAFVHGAVADSASDVLLHVHHERTVADLLDCAAPGTSHGGAECSGGGDCSLPASNASSLDGALRSVAAAGAGVVVYLRGQSARGLPPSAELAALGSGGAGAGSLYSCDLKDAAAVAQMLRQLGVRSVALAGGEGPMATALRSCGLAVRPAPAAAAAAAGGAAAQHVNGNGSSNGHVRSSPLQAAGMR
ncbi:hypothetical protein HYH02_007424 [Chlamydomonas schloesseri]|uniref:3,4-dihydroxy-2-butanone-4-phosphate synthase n=1 Tax=Chlamydomonas schloesseri TaxID=2026947 RepID=A0A835WHL6_9CHLO|nr:hypothetical protein HYH02_007424 [Chlamydomonas schloesseri]|eukprot:KAG2447498.1 hypothetical protein HYH02_007424 [Chlamydomonas schloesseri]